MRNVSNFDATRQNLIDAFCILNKKKTVRKITIRELVDKAGYNRSTFYKYFRDIYDVAEHIENSVLNQVKENFRQKISAEDFGQSFFAAFTKIQREQANYFDVLFRPDNRPRFVEKLLAEISPTFMETFHLPPDAPRSKYLTEIYFATVLSAAKLWIDGGREFSAEELSKFLSEVLTMGVLPAIKNFSSQVVI